MNTSLKFLRGDTVTGGRGRQNSAQATGGYLGCTSEPGSKQGSHRANVATGVVDDVEPYTDEQLRMMPIAHQYSS